MEGRTDLALVLFQHDLSLFFVTLPNVLEKEHEES